MNNAATKIEKIMELTLSLNDDFAKNNALIRDLETKLSSLNTLKEVNYYMGSELDLGNVINIIFDVVMGVLGVSSSSICLKSEDTWEIKEHSVIGKGKGIVKIQDVDFLEEEILKHNGELVIHDLSETTFLDFKTGSFLALPLTRGQNQFGIITLYYSKLESIDAAKIEFFKLITAQLCIHIENSFLYEKVKLSSITDGLSGLFNRLHLNEIIHKANNFLIIKSGIIMIDIDNFKKVNDTYGHIFGDTVIKELSNILKTIQKEQSTIKSFRYGGEEFLVLCNNLNQEEIISLADRIRSEFNNIKFKDASSLEVSFSISLGISLFGTSTKILDISALIDCSDEALYFSKRNGKNRYTLSTGELQLFEKSKDAIRRLISKYRRFQSPFTIYQIEFILKDNVSKSDFQNIYKSISALFRDYDCFYSNSVGEFIAILDDMVALEVIKKRFNERLDPVILQSISINSVNFDGNIQELASFFHLNSTSFIKLLEPY